MTVDSDLSFKTHIGEQVSKANRQLGLVRRTFDYLDGPMMKQLFPAVVRPHLEYGASIWRPHTKEGQQQIEGVLRRATAMVPEVRDLEYEDRLRALNMPSMKYRHRRGDMIEAWKHLHGRYRLDEPVLKLADAAGGVSKRSDTLKLVRNEKKGLVDKFFPARVARDWNSLPNSVKTAPSMNSFKNRLDSHWKVYKFRSPYGAFADYELIE